LSAISADRKKAKNFVDLLEADDICIRKATVQSSGKFTWSRG